MQLGGQIAAHTQRRQTAAQVPAMDSVGVPIFRLTADGKDITLAVENRLESLSLSVKRGFEANPRVKKQEHSP
jgi:hypothetical protein